MVAGAGPGNHGAGRRAWRRGYGSRKRGHDFRLPKCGRSRVSLRRGPAEAGTDRQRQFCGTRRRAAIGHSGQTERKPWREMRPKARAVILRLLILLTTQLAHAQLLSVDINKS